MGIKVIREGWCLLCNERCNYRHDVISIQRQYNNILDVEYPIHSYCFYQYAGIMPQREYSYNTWAVIAGEEYQVEPDYIIQTLDSYINFHSEEGNFVVGLGQDNVNLYYVPDWVKDYVMKYGVK